MHAIAGQKLATLNMAGAVLLGTTKRRSGDPGPKIFSQGAIVRGVGAEACARRINQGGQPGHAPISSRPISIRRISLVPAPISSSLASRAKRSTGQSLV